MRILYVTARYPPLLGGTEIHTHEVAHALASRGHEVAVLTTDLTGELPAAESVGGVEVVRVRAHPRRRDYYFAPRALRFLRHERPDLVHIQGYHTAFAPLALAALNRTGQPFVISFHSGGAASLWRRLGRPVQQRMLSRYLLRARRLIAVSEFERRLFTSRLGVSADDIAVVPNGVSNYIYEPAGDVGRDPDLICSVGRLERYKNHHLTIEALPRVRRERPDARLRLVGRGPFQSELEELVRSRGLRDAVDFNWVPQPDRARLGAMLREAALSVQVSSYESEGIGVLEALAAGCRVVVADGTALSEHVALDGVTPVSSPPRVDELADTMLDALAAGPRAAPMPARTWDEVADDLLAVYKQALA